MKANNEIGNGATFSPCRTWRYDWRREWDQHKPLRVWILLNPSIANEISPDPTVTRCVIRDQEEGFGAIVVVNIFALVSTNPQTLYAHPDPIGPTNDIAIARWVVHPRCKQVVCGWGNHGRMLERGKAVLELVRVAGKRPSILKISKLGQPVHPLYQPYSLRPTYL